MSTFLQLIFTLIVILVTAKLAGYIATRIGQPSVLGELIAGIVLGPSLINVLHVSVFSNSAFLEEAIRDMGELGVLFLMFLAGLELHPRELTKNRKTSSLACIGGVLLSIAFGVAIGVMLGSNLINAFFLGLCIGATSVSISAQILMEIDQLRSILGTSLLGAAVLDDIIIILLLSGFLAFTGGVNGWQAIVLKIGEMLVFLILSVIFGFWLLPWLSRFVSKHSARYGIVTFTIVVLLTYSLASEWFGQMAAITGAFIAGLMFNRTSEKAIIENSMRTLAYTFFVPIFFVNIGLGLDTHLLKRNFFWIALILIMISILGKIIGAGMGAKLSGFKWRESLQLGIGMVARGEVTLIAVKIGLDNGYLTNDISSAIIATVIATSLLTPPFLRLALKWKERDLKSLEEEA
jgi:Kef-type K+ transport system membrane component KefB